MTTPEFNGRDTAPRPFSAWTFDDEHRILAEARRLQAAALRSYAATAFRAIGKLFGTVVTPVFAAVAQARAMSELSRLSDRQLADIGIKRSDIPGLVVNNTPAGGHRMTVPGLKGWAPRTKDASNDWHGSAAA